MAAASGQLQDGFATVLLRCSEADTAATRDVYKRYQPQLVRLAQNLGADDPEGSADLAFFDGLRAIENLHTRSELSFRSYLYTATRNRVVSEHRRGSVETTPLDWDDGGSHATGVENHVVDSLFLKNALHELSPDQRAVIVHRFFGGYSSDETARRLGKSTSAVRRLQHTGLKNLRRACVAAGLVALAVAVALLWNAQVRQQRIDIGPVVELPTVSTADRSEPAQLPTTTKPGTGSTRSPATQLRSGIRNQRSAPLVEQPSAPPSSNPTVGRASSPPSSPSTVSQSSSQPPSTVAVTPAPASTSATQTTVASTTQTTAASTTQTTVASTTSTSDDDDDDDDDDGDD